MPQTTYDALYQVYTSRILSSGGLFKGFTLYVRSVHLNQWTGNFEQTFVPGLIEISSAETFKNIDDGRLRRQTTEFVHPILFQEAHGSGKPRSLNLTKFYLYLYRHQITSKRLAYFQFPLITYEFCLPSPPSVT